MTKRIFISGASSFISLNISKYFIENGYEVYGFYRPNTKNLNNIKEIKGLITMPFDFNNMTINDINNLNQNLEYKKIFDNEFTSYLDLAWDGQGKIGRDNYDIQMSNIDLSKKNLELAKLLNVKQFIFFGSQSEYSDTPHGIAKREFSKYGIDKSKQYNIDFIHLKIFSTYGFGDRENSLISQIMNSIIKKEDIHIGSCQKLWNYLYIDDLIKIIFYFVNNNIKTTELDIGSDDTRKLRDFILRIKELTKADINFIFSDDELIKDKFSLPDLTNLKNIINGIEFTDFDTGIMNTYKSYLRKYENN